MEIFNMFSKIFGVLQRIGKAFMLPIALLPAAGILLGIGGAFLSLTTLDNPPAVYEGLINFINIGLGINVNNDPASIEPRAASLRQLLDRSVSRKKLLAALLDKFESRVAHYDLEDVIDQWKRYTDTVGRLVKIVTYKDEFEGKAYERVLTVVKLTDNRTVDAYIYALRRE